MSIQRFPPKVPQITTRINHQIRVREVRLIGTDGNQEGVVPIDHALKKAAEAQLDLVEVAPQANPPVCKILDFSKYRYEQEKQQRENLRHQRSHLKEVRFRPQIDDNDYQTKLRSLLKFLKRGDKVKVTVMFRGREMAHQEFGFRLLDRLKSDLESLAQVERPPLQEGRFVFMTVAPK